MTRGASENGFSLVEILVVLAIIAAGAALTLSAIGGGERRAASFAERLALDIDQAVDRAIAQRAPVSIRLHQGGYEIAPEGASRRTPDGVRLTFKDELRPIDPIGGAPGFEIEVRSGGVLARVVFDGLDAQAETEPTR